MVPRHTLKANPKQVRPGTRLYRTQRARGWGKISSAKHLQKQRQEYFYVALLSPHRQSTSPLSPCDIVDIQYRVAEYLIEFPFLLHPSPALSNQSPSMETLL